jgi:uncharacterized tellurite resistance protein B-like protein
MSLISRLRDVIHQIVEPDEASPDYEERLTAAALLVLVARADGRLLPVEQAGLTAMLRSRFAISQESAGRILDAAGSIDGALDQASSLAERALQDTDPEDRPRLLAMAYRVAAVDGFVHEFEDDLVWRIGRLLRLDEGAVAAIREDAFRNLSPERASRA